MQKQLIETQTSNFKTFLMYKTQLMTLAENVFEFLNMPEEIDIAYMNEHLLRDGAVAFFKDEIANQFAVLPFGKHGEFDMYGRPIRVDVFGMNGYTRTLEKDEFVIIYDNNRRESLFLDLLQYAERMGQCKRVIDINIAHQKTPRIWLAKNDKVATMKRLLNQYEGNVETIMGYDNINLDDVNCIFQPAPYVADKIDQHLDREFAEFLRLIGVANLTQQKKERLITDEVQQTQGGTIASRFSRFEPRARAIEKINKKWNLNIKVRYYDGEPTTENEEQEGKNDDVLSNNANLSNISKIAM